MNVRFYLNLNKTLNKLSIYCLYMAEVPELFKGLRITSYYKYLLYFCGIIFILSLFLELKGINVNDVRRACFWVIVVSLGVWFLEDIEYLINRRMYEHYIRKSGRDMEEYYTSITAITSMSYVIQIVAWVIVLANIT